jgi:regulator of replication initiation timing
MTPELRKRIEAEAGRIVMPILRDMISRGKALEMAMETAEAMLKLLTEMDAGDWHDDRVESVATARANGDRDLAERLISMVRWRDSQLQPVIAALREENAKLKLAYEEMYARICNFENDPVGKIERQNHELRARVSELMEDNAWQVRKIEVWQERESEARLQFEKLRARVDELETKIALSESATALVNQAARIDELEVALEKNKSEWEAVHPEGYKYLVAWQVARQALERGLDGQREKAD